MAGSYLHLHLATSVFPTTFEADETRHPREHAAFLAGALGPDLGFFPGGPRHFSQRVHREHSGDLVRALLACAADPVEEAYAAGWALHVYTDIATHPLVNEQADDHRCRHSRQPPGRRDLWHKRVEWGIDCLVLERCPHRPPLWRTPLEFPATSTGECLLARASRPLFPDAVDDFSLRRGWASALRWVQRLAPILQWTGACRLPGSGKVQALTGAALRPLVETAGRAVENLERWEDLVALITPIRPDVAFADRMLRAAHTAADAFRPAWSSRFADLANVELDSGGPPPGSVAGSSPREEPGS